MFSNAHQALYKKMVMQSNYVELVRDSFASNKDKQVSHAVMQMQETSMNSIQKLTNTSIFDTRVDTQNSVVQFSHTHDTISSCNIETPIVYANANVVNDINIVSRYWSDSIDCSTQPPTTRLDLLNGVMCQMRLLILWILIPKEQLLKKIFELIVSKTQKEENSTEKEIGCRL